MRVLNVGASLDPVTGGGEAERNFQMSRFIAKSGIDCSILTTDVGLTDEHRSKLEGIEIVACPCAWRRFYVPRGCLQAIRDVVARADIVHIMGHWTIFNAIAYFYVRWYRKPYVVCPAGALPIFGRSKFLKRLYNSLIGAKIVRNAERCIAVTESEIPQMKRDGVAAERIVVIPNGVSIDESDVLDTNSFRERHDLVGTTILLFVGRLNYIKGPDLLVRGFCQVKDRIPDCTLVVAGPDEGMLTMLERIAARYGASDRVRFSGYIGGTEKLQAYKAADLLVIPSRQESMSIVVLEAGRAGTPVLITKQCAFDEIEDAGAGMVVDASSAELGEGMVRILKDRSQLEDMGRRFREYTAELFDWNVVVRQYIDLYKAILDAHPER